jgi:hypothetical protein
MNTAEIRIKFIKSIHQIRADRASKGRQLGYLYLVPQA